MLRPKASQTQALGDVDVVEQRLPLGTAQHRGQQRPQVAVAGVDIDLIAHGDKEPSAGLHVRDEGGGGGGGQACDVGENDDVNAHEGGGIEAIGHCRGHGDSALPALSDAR